MPRLALQVGVRPTATVAAVTSAFTVCLAAQFVLAGRCCLCLASRRFLLVLLWGVFLLLLLCPSSTAAAVGGSALLGWCPASWLSPRQGVCGLIMRGELVGASCTLRCHALGTPWCKGPIALVKMETPMPR